MLDVKEETESKNMTLAERVEAAEGLQKTGREKDAKKKSGMEIAKFKKEAKLPWSKVLSYLPQGYLLDDKGLWLKKDGKSNVFISGPIWVSAYTYSPGGISGWGVVLEWIDQNGKTNKRAFSNILIHSSGAPLAGMLGDMGLQVIPSQRNALTAYVCKFKLPNDCIYRVCSVDRIGWLEKDGRSNIYVLPNKTLSINTKEEVVFQDGYIPQTMQSKGSLDQWKKFVAEPCTNNPIPIFVLSTALSGPLLKHAGVDSGGVHLYGASSKGKTASLQIGGSVFGCGAEPGVSEKSFIDRWNSTGNAFEATAALHNDGLLVLDELGVCDGRIVGNVVYNLSGGKGKNRLSKESTLKSHLNWRIIIISTGELSIRQKIEESGKKPKEGQLSRIIDIPIGKGVFTDTHDIDPRSFVDKLKDNCGLYYGTAGPEFIEKLIGLEGDAPSLQRYLKSRIDECYDELVVDGLETHQLRVIKKLAIYMLGGLLGVEFGILPFTSKDVIESFHIVIKAWLGDDSNISEETKGLKNLQDFILSKKDIRFKNADTPELDSTKLNLAGFFDDKKRLYMFLDNGFEEACNGVDYRRVLHELDKRGFLFKNNNRFKSTFNVSSFKERIGLYAIRYDFLSYELNQK